MAEAEARESAATALLDLTESAMRNPPEPATRDAVVQTDLTTCHIRCLEEKHADVRAVEKCLLTELNVMMMLSDFILAFPLTPGSKLFLTWHLCLFSAKTLSFVIQSCCLHHNVFHYVYISQCIIMQVCTGMHTVIRKYYSYYLLAFFLQSGQNHFFFGICFILHGRG